jgi:glycosyltransferase involved in cell wall biosynthesis
VTTVLHLITTLDRGGAENALLHLCRGLHERGSWRPEVAYLKGRGELRADFEAAGVAVHDLVLRGVRGVGAYGRGRRLARELAPDVIHTHLFKADCLGAAIAGAPRANRTRLVSTKHNQDMYLHGPSARAAAWRAVARRVAARADAVVAISPSVARFVAETLGDAPSRVETIPYGVPDPAPDAVRVDGAAFRAAHGIAPDDPVLLCVARLDEQKDHETLLRAFAAARSCRPTLRLVLLGRGPLEARLRAAAARLPAGSVVFAGFLENPAPAYAAADVAVLSSRWEGLGLVLVEAALHGVPAVATRAGGVVDVVEDGVTGRLVPIGDDAALAAAIGAAADDPEVTRRMGAAARERALREHALDVYVHRAEALYGELLERAR